jgi:hypothetical protein
MFELIKKEELLKYGVTQTELMERFLLQLQKDFQLSALDSYLQISESVSPEEIHRVVAETLKEITIYSSAKFQDLIYRIDISDKDYVAAIRNNKDETFNLLAELIIKRILQKVILKLVHSN